MEEIDNFFANLAKMNAEGTLTVKDAIFGYYRLRQGIHAGKVIIKTHSQIDGKDICYFANGLTWIHTEKIENILCEKAYPTFNEPHHPIDRSIACWYNDNSNEKSFHKW